MARAEAERDPVVRRNRIEELGWELLEILFSKMDRMIELGVRLSK